MPILDQGHGLPLSFELQYPPSVNTYWRRVGVRTIVSEAGRRYQESVKAVIRHSGFAKKLDCPVTLHIEAYPPDDRERDIDNILKGILDSLKVGGVFVKDSWVKKLDVEMHRPHRPDGLIYIEVSLYTPR